jgi:hypothetical protein
LFECGTIETWADANAPATRQHDLDHACLARRSFQDMHGNEV